MLIQQSRLAVGAKSLEEFGIDDVGERHRFRGLE